MFKFILRRVGVAIPTLLILVTVSFYMMQSAPGGPFTSEKTPPAAVMANIEAKYGLNQPLHVQLVRYIKGIVLHGDFGPSYKYKDRTVKELIGYGLPVTLEYGIWSFIAAVIVGVSIGVVAALNHNTWIDYSSMGITFGAQAFPNFVLAPLLTLFFAIWWNILPAGGWNADQPDHWKYVILPVIALSTSYMASIARITRASMLETLHSNFIRTAKAKGLPYSYIIWRHALKPSMLPVISYLGPAFVGMITGSIVIDQFFNTGGLGIHFVQSAMNRDYSVLLGVTILLGTLTIFFNALVDVLYAWIDPKIRY